jgi:hypothetical protein
LKSNAFWVENTSMALMYINKIFVRHLGQSGSSLSEKASKLLSTALFLNEQTKIWENPYPQTPRERLDFIKNQNEFSEKKWILLKKIQAEFVQEGPFSTLEIYDLISSSRVRLEDPIWKEGFSKWLPIKQTETFKELNTISQPAEVDITNILNSVEEYRPRMRRVEEESPSPGSPGEVFMILDDK